jgi:hypothetical protein
MQNMRERIERGDLDAERKEAIQVRFLYLHMLFGVGN